MNFKIIYKYILAATALVIVTLNVNASANEHSEDAGGESSIKENIKATIQHHLLDAYEFTIVHNEVTGAAYGFPLPIILWDGGLQVFMSNKFNHGETVAEVNGNYYKLYHNKIYKTGAHGTLTMDEHNHPTNTHPLDFSITKNVFVSLLMAIFMLLIFGGLAKSYKKGFIPTGFGRFMEPIILFVRDDIAIPNIGEKYYKNYMSYLLTVFFFIWFINLTGLTPLGVNITGNIAVTFALALMTFFITQFTAKADYWKHIFWMPGVPVPMKIILAPIELLGVIIKPFALMIRLYANITAGHIVIMSLIGLLFVFNNWFARGAFLGLTLFLSIIELLVAALQAYIFTMLTALYFGMAVEEHSEEHH